MQHCAIFAPDGYILTTDFSGDRILCFSYNKRDKKLEDHGIAANVKPGSGPRHLVFSPNGKYAYLMSELSGKVTVYSYSDGKLKELQSIAADYANARGGADIHVSPDGSFVYASTRLKGDGITIFRVNNNGTLTRVGAQRTAKHPRNFAITPMVSSFLLLAVMITQYRFTHVIRVRVCLRILIKMLSLVTLSASSSIQSSVLWSKGVLGSERELRY